MNRKYKVKIINDPVHGFIMISSPLIYSILEHPYLQRLRNIKQLGLTNLVYPGACHNRFQHALGAMYLMERALVISETVSNRAYSPNKQSILIKYNDGRLMDIFDASDMLKYSNIDEEVHKYMLVYPK